MIIFRMNCVSRRVTSGTSWHRIGNRIGALRYYSDEKKKRNDYLLLQAIRGEDECGLQKAPTEEKEDQLNSVRTLPRYDLLKDVEQIRKEVVNEREDGTARGYDAAIVHYRKAKNLFKFFKEGIVNVWKVNRALRQGVFGGGRYIVDYSKADVESGGRHALERSDFSQVVDEVSERVSLLKIEYERGRRNVEEFLGRGADGREVLLSRREFVEMVRDKENFVKLPLFGALFIVLEELSIPFIYVFPQMLPGTCVLPGVLEKRYYDRSVRAFERLKELEDGSDAREKESKCRDFVQAVAMNKISAFNDELISSSSSSSSSDRKNVSKLRDVCHTLHCRGTTPEALQQHQKILLADDYLIVADGGVGRLNAAEVVHGCLRRGLCAGQADIFASAATTDVSALRQQLGHWLDVRFGLV